MNKEQKQLLKDLETYFNNEVNFKSDPANDKLIKALNVVSESLDKLIRNK